MVYKTTEEHRRRSRDYYSSHREEILEKQRAYAVEHPEVNLMAKRRYNDRNRNAIRSTQRNRAAMFLKNVQLWKRTQGCTDCGRTDGRLIHHHIDPETKSHSVSQMSRYSLEDVYDEISKCVVVCMSCHKKRHLGVEGE